MKEGKYLVYTQEKGIGVLKLNRPPYNIFEEAFYVELDEFQHYLATLDDLHCLIICAEGKSFSSGIDLNYLKKIDSQLVIRRVYWMQGLYGFWQTQSYPVISAVQGLCTGSGFEMILGTDIRIAADNARFSLPEVCLGLSPDCGGTARLTRIVGMGQAKRLLMTGMEIASEEALRIGLVEEVVPLENLFDRAMQLAKILVRNPHAAVTFAKKGVNVADENLQAGLLFEHAQSAYCCGSEDKARAVEGMMAMLAARKQAK